jgi:hypothetical protein
MKNYQCEVKNWLVECFGQTTANDRVERNWRFLEEALELVQSLGSSAEDAHKLVDYVFSRDVGEPFQEVGGTMVCLAGLCAAASIDMENAALTELERINSSEIMEKIRRKHAAKPHKSPLPGDYKFAVAERAKRMKP